jgi:protein-S-isoprenylcysteine O-methyltransferase
MRPLFVESAGYAIAFWGAFALWAVLEALGSLTQHSKGGAARRDRGSYAILAVTLALGIFLSFTAAASFHFATITWHRLGVFWTGVALMLAGIAFRWYAIRVLGRYFTRDVATRAGQKVVQSGPYRFIRHPSYSGTLLVLLGMGLAMTNWASLAALILFGLAGHIYRVQVEETALIQALGQPYLDYIRRTKRFIPFVL